MSTFIARHKEQNDLICEVLQSHILPYALPPKEEGGEVQRGYSSLCSVIWFRESAEGLEPLGTDEYEECPGLESARLLEFEALDWEDYHDDGEGDGDIIDEEITTAPIATSQEGQNVAEKETPA